MVFIYRRGSPKMENAWVPTVRDATCSTPGKLLRNELMPQPEELEDKPRRSLADLLGLRRKEGDNGAEE